MNGKSIPEVPESRKHWVVRAEGGRYYSNFTKHGVIAIGHLDRLNIQNKNKGDPFFSDLDHIYTRMKEAAPKDSPRNSVTVSFHQVDLFISKMKIGDWIITVGDDSIRYGRIVSQPYINHEKITVVHDQKSDRKTEMELSLRRDVSWGPTIRRKSLPYGLIQTLRANQTVFSIQRHLEAIYHTIYPAFLYQQKLHLSTSINREEKIPNQSVTTLFRTLSEVEILSSLVYVAEKLSDSELSEFRNLPKSKEEVAAFVRNEMENADLTLSTKANFHSPGEVWNMVELAPILSSIQPVVLDFLKDVGGWAASYYPIHSFIFGNSKLGIGAILDPGTKQQILAAVIEYLKEKRQNKALSKLNLSEPKKDTEALESDEKDDRPKEDDSADKD